MTILRRVIPAKLRALGDDEVEAIISTGDVARDGHVLVPEGCDLSGFRANPIILWAHDPGLPVGRAEEVTVGGNKISSSTWQSYFLAGWSHRLNRIVGAVFRAEDEFTAVTMPRFAAPAAGVGDVRDEQAAIAAAQAQMVRLQAQNPRAGAGVLVFLSWRSSRRRRSLVVRFSTWAAALRCAAWSIFPL
jgi:hypothetical protein